jgi:hypothetical protein
MPGLRPVVNDEQLAVPRILVDRRRSLGEDHTGMVSQLHHPLLELIPGGAKKDLSARQAKALLAKVRPRDAAGRTRRRVAAELISDLERIYTRKKAANKELTELVAANGTGTSPVSRTRPTSRPGTAPPSSTPPPATRSGICCLAVGTGRSTGSCTVNRKRKLTPCMVSSLRRQPRGRGRGLGL